MRDRDVSSIQGDFGPKIEKVLVSAYTIPTAVPESDGTLEWDRTTLVLVDVSSGSHHGIGYTYADVATALFVKQNLAQVVEGRDAMHIADAWWAMMRAIRNLGHPGVASMAIAAVDTALWDLKARLLDLPLVSLLGRVRTAVPVYGSGGFTSYSIDQLEEQLGGWAQSGIPRVKMKVGRQPDQDLFRVQAARRAIGEDAELFVDANGAYDRKQALQLAEGFAKAGVVWFEEPVSSDDLEGLRLLRNMVPAPIQVTAGEYGYDLFYFRRLLDGEAIDVLQADASRCGGITGFLKVGSLCEARPIPLSAHCAPSLHVHPGCASMPVCHIEYFYDHLRIEQLLFDGALRPVGGALYPDLSRPGIGLQFKYQDARRYQV
ncbi:MAG: enolase C-terminal domain-like protein [Nitrospira sp.]